MQITGNQCLCSLRAASGDIAPYGIDAVPCDVNRDVRLAQRATGVPAMAVKTSLLCSHTCSRNNRAEKGPAELGIRGIHYCYREAVE
jgi:hypothetical protein